MASEDDTFEELSPQEQEIFEENSTPIEPEEAVYAENIDLTDDEVAERQLDMVGEYQLGEPLSNEDLEFLRAYLLDDTSTGSEGAAEPAIVNAGFAESSSPVVQRASQVDVVPAALFSSTSRFNVSKTLFGSSVNAAGSSSLKISKGSWFNNTWSATWTAKRTAGLSLTKIKSEIQVDGYGAVTAWPFVGLIYSTKQSGSTSAQSYGFQRSGVAAGALVQLNIACRSYFTNAKGSLQVP